VPFRLLEEVTELSCPPAEGDTENLIVQGDNLEALKALLPRYAGQVKCIYIDPPYNTGNEGWVYNDAVNSPEIRQWLGHAVGKEADDLSRHDKWLCMMYPRLVLLRQFLRDDGAIFVSIDDNEASSLRFVMDEIFGPNNFVATVIWQKMDSPKNTALHLSEDHDYIVIYARNGNTWRPNKLARSEAMLARYKNPDNDPRGPWLLSDLAARNAYSAGRYPITTPKGRVIDGPPAGSYWRVSKEKFAELEKDGRIWWGKSGDNRPGIKRFLSEVQEGVVPQTLWFWKDVGSTRHAKQELSQLMAARASQDLFITPKPSALIQRILQIATSPGDLILDSFAGSGTTGHAVLALNAAEKARTETTESTEKQNLQNPSVSSASSVRNPPRRFILVEIDEKIARDITAERVRRVAKGYTNAKGEGVAGLGGGFQFARLGKPLFDETGAIRSDVKFGELAEFVFFKETGRPMPRTEHTKDTERKGKNGKSTLRGLRDLRASPLLGVHDGRAVYLLFNGILADKSVGGGNVLTGPVLAKLPKHDGPKVVYAAACRLGRARLESEQITFKQTPYDLQV